MTAGGLTRAALLDEVAGLVPVPAAPGCVRVGIDGVDGVGKSTFAGELAAALTGRGREVVQVSADDFHHPRAVRHRRGRDSPVGFWLDSYDHAALIGDVLRPFGPGGSRRYRPAAHDLETDEVLDLPWRVAAPGTVLIVDGLFLHRDELVGFWDFSVFLDAPFEVTVARLAQRDGPSPRGAGRYVGGQRLYFAACDPRRRAGVVVDNGDLSRPVLLRASEPGGHEQAATYQAR
jgi:uridine kinase